MTPEVLMKTARAAGWVARIGGLLLALLFFAFVAGEGLPRHWNAEMLTQFLALFGMAAGLLIAWKWEGLGGAITLAAFVLLFVANRHFVVWAGWSLFVTVPAVLGVIHLLCWFVLRGAHAGSLPRAVWAALGIFVLLCANEIFGSPPLMTRRPPAPGLVGTWRAPGVVLTIAADGALTGSIDSQPFTAARVEGNRSWFGALMHWRTDYAIRGNFAAESTNGLLVVAGPTLEGDLTIHGRMRRFTASK